MGALRLWEDALGAGTTPEQRRVALFNSTAVHAGFGDVELAQITLREAVQGGLDFRAAVEDPAALDPLLVKLVASQQVLIRLRKFNEATLKKAGARAAAPPPAFAAGGGAGARAGASARAALLEKDLSKILETDMQGIDTSALGECAQAAAAAAAAGCGGLAGHARTPQLPNDARSPDQALLRCAGIVRRVAILLLALSGLGAALFYLGLKYFLQDVS
jgi:hypothetical protein